MHTKQIIGVGLVLAMAVAVLPTASGQLGFGTIAMIGDGDITPILTQPADNTLCFLDLDTSGQYGVGDVVYLNVGTNNACGSIGVNWIRITAYQSFAAGSKVKFGDGDYTATSGVLIDGDTADAIRMYDRDSDGEFDEGDTLYFDVGATDNSVGTGDIRVTPFGALAAGTIVAAGDSDQTQALAAVNGAGDAIDDAFAYLNADNIGGFGLLDIPYLLGQNAALVDGDTILAGVQPVPVANNVRLGPYLTGGPGFGTRIMGGDDDAVATLTQASATARICAISEDGTVTYKAGWEVIVRPSGTACGAAANSAVNDLRLTGDNRGMKIGPVDADEGSGPLAEMAAAGGVDIFRYYDLDDNGAFNTGDTLYLDPNADGLVNQGDVRLTAFGTLVAGSTVMTGDADHNLNMAAVGATTETEDGLYYWDLDSDGTFNGNDVMYWRSSVPVAGATFVLQHFVRLGPLTGTDGFGSITQSGDSEVSVRLAPVDEESTTLDAVHSFCAIDENGNNAYDVGEPVIIDISDDDCAGNSASNDIRVSNSDHGGIGTFITSNAADRNAATVDIWTGGSGGLMRYYDQDNNNVFSQGDTLYAVSGGLAAATAGNVGTGWVRLTPFGSFAAGTAVRQGDADQNQGTGLAAADFDLSSVLYYYDATGNGGNVPNGADVVYLVLGRDPTNPTALNVRTPVQTNDVRLGAAGDIAGPGPGTTTTTGTTGATTATTTPGDTTTQETTEATTTAATTTQQTTQTTTAATTPTGTGGDDGGDDNGAPGLGLVGVLAALGVALVILRRRK